MAKNPVPNNSSRKIAVLGNPNTGKSTLFNALTGVQQSTGNFPGVTVSRKTGRYQFDQQIFEVVDFPGCYSLAAHTAEELVVVDALVGRSDEPRPDIIVCVVNADNLERNLFLLTQILELEIPTVVALNMNDVAQRHGKTIKTSELQRILNVPIVEIQANQGMGLQQLKQQIVASSTNPGSPIDSIFDSDTEKGIAAIAREIESVKYRFTASRLLFDVDDLFSKRIEDGLNQEKRARLAEIRKTCCYESSSESELRYAWIRQHINPVVATGGNKRHSISDGLDRWLTHRFFGLIVAVLALMVSFQLVFWIAEPASQIIDGLNTLFASIVDSLLAEGALSSLLKDGLISGVGGVLVFLPQILLVFLILGVLEDSGYLARAAFLIDRYLSKLGLSGVTTFPLLSSFACAIPGIMATRIISNDRERLVTILIAPLMSCSARLPVYVLLIAVFVPDHPLLGGWLRLPGVVMFAMYMVGIVAAVGVAWILKRTILQFEDSTFVMELPTYKLPSFRNVGHRMFNGGWAFVRDAGTMIVAVTIIVWALAYFPRVETDNVDGLSDQKLAAIQLEQSYLGRMGKFVEPVVKPLGWDWRIGSAAIASFPAREVMVSTMGVIFGLGGDVDEEDGSLRSALKTANWQGTQKPLFTLPVALSIMVFFALCAQCVSTLAVIKRETNSYKWPIFTFTYMTLLAYAGAWVTYNLAVVFV